MEFELVGYWSLAVAQKSGLRGWDGESASGKGTEGRGSSIRSTMISGQQ